MTEVTANVKCTTCITQGPTCKVGAPKSDRYTPSGRHMLGTTNRLPPLPRLPSLNLSIAAKAHLTVEPANAPPPACVPHIFLFRVTPRNGIDEGEDVHHDDEGFVST